ncbi:MAG: alkaline phosphatase family protein [Caldithrix sp.]|nr:alkaline phosphatase family protein [Caldithrix sp.]
MRKFMVVFILMAAFYAATILQAADDKPYVIVVSFDGFRWDYTDRGLTPNLDRLMDRGVKAQSFEPVFPSKTFPNHYSIVTGLYTPNHGLISNHFRNPYTGEEYRLGDTVSVRQAKWYRGETIWVTAQRQGVKTASFFWPGSETEPGYTHPTYFKYYDGSIPHKERVDGVIEWLSLPEEQRPQLIFLYFSDTDTQGHRHGPDSPQLNAAIKLVDRQLGYLQQRLQEIGMAEQVNTIVLSDHGMSSVTPERLIRIDRFVDLSRVTIDDGGPFMRLSVKDPYKKDDVLEALQKQAEHFRVYRKTDIPNHWHYRNSPFIGDLLLVADVGWSLVKDAAEAKRLQKPGTRGNHGYDNHALDMHGIFVAAGPAFKEGYRTGTLHNIDVYPLLVDILGLTPNPMIDGKAERIRFILK